MNYKFQILIRNQMIKKIIRCRDRIKMMIKKIKYINYKVRTKKKKIYILRI